MERDIASRETPAPGENGPGQYWDSRFWRTPTEYDRSKRVRIANPDAWPADAPVGYSHLYKGVFKRRFDGEAWQETTERVDARTASQMLGISTGALLEWIAQQK